MFKNLSLVVLAVLTINAFCAAWELIPEVSYGVSYLDGAPCAYVETEPARETNEPLGAALGAAFGRYAVEVSYLPRYDLYAVIGPVHDFTAVGRAAPIYRDKWAVGREVRGAYGVFIRGGAGVHLDAGGGSGRRIRAVGMARA